MRYPDLYFRIINNLKNGPKKGDELIKSIKLEMEKEGKEFPKNEKKAYTKAFTRLLEDEKIDILKFSGKRSQNIDCLDFSYTLIKTEPKEILKLIEDSQYAPERQKELEILFYKRISDTQYKFKRNWKTLICKAKEEKLDEKKINCSKLNNILIYDIYNNEITNYSFSEETAPPTRLLSFNEKKIKLAKEYKTWKYPETCLKKFVTPNKTIITECSFFKQDIDKIHLLKAFNIYPPKIRKPDEIKSLFQKSLMYLNLRNENLKNEFKEGLAFALSEDQKADPYLYEVIMKLTKPNFSKRTY